MFRNFFKLALHPVFIKLYQIIFKSCRREDIIWLSYILGSDDQFAGNNSSILSALWWGMLGHTVSYFFCDFASNRVLFLQSSSAEGLIVSGPIIVACYIYYHNYHNYCKCFVSFLFPFPSGTYFLIVLPKLIQTVVNQSDLLWGQTQSAQHISGGF